MKNSTRFPWEHDGEVVVFETPEQTRIEHRIAPFGARIAAAVLDYVFLFTLGFLLWGTIIMGFLTLWGPATQGIVYYFLAGAFVLQLLLSMFYFVWCELRGEGRTRGKRHLGLRTIMAGGQGITLGAAIVRNVARIVDNLPILWLVPVLVKGRRRLGDLLAGTLVVLDEARAGGPGPVSMAAGLAPSLRDLADRKFYFTAETSARLFPDDLNLIEHLEARIRDALPAQKKKVREEVARKYVERLGLQAEETQVLEDPKRFLDELYLFLKDRFEGQAY